MENYKTRLTEQAKALQIDIDKMVENIKSYETMMDGMKEEKSKAWRELKSIEKKLAKL